MTITRVGAAKATVGAGTYTAAYSQAPTVGNLLVMGVFVPVSSGTPTCATPSGWTAGPTGGATSGAYTGRIFLFWKVAAGADTAPSLVTNTTVTNADAIVEEWSGLNATTPLDASSTVGTNNQNSTAAGSCNSGPLTTTLAGDWIWSFMGALTGAAARTLTWGGGSTSSSGFYDASGSIQTSTATQTTTSVGTYTPALAFAAGSAGWSWHVSGTASMAFRPANAAPNAPTLTSLGTFDRGVTQRLPWVFSDPDVGDSQSKFDLQYRLGTGAWTLITGTTPNSFWDAAPSTFSAATYEWQVRTYDHLGLVGPWSVSSFFIAADAPTGATITAPTSGSTIATASATVTWSAPSQTDYQIRRVADIAGAADPSTVYWDSGDVVDATIRSVAVAFPTNSRWEHIQIRNKDAGMWTSWADSRNLVSWTPPMAATIVATTFSGTASISVTLTNPTPTGGAPDVSYNDIYISSPVDPEIRWATGVAPNGTWVFREPASGRVYTIRAVAVGTTGGTATSVDMTVVDGGDPTTTVFDITLDGGTP